MSGSVRHERSPRLNRELVTTYAIVLVLMAYFGLRHFYPTLFAFFVSFNKYDLLTGAFSFVGIDNYIDTFTDQRSMRSIANTSIYVVGNVVGDTLLGLFFALLLDRMGKGSVVLRTIYFMPVVVSVVALSQLWIWIYHRDLGLLNWALSLVGIGKVGWLVDTRYALSSIIIMNVWREMGFALVIFLAGLNTIPEHFYDAARGDGASAWQVARRVTIPDDLLDAARIDGSGVLGRYWHVVVPNIKPAIGTITIFAFLGAWNNFLWPLIILNSRKKMLLEQVLSVLTAEFAQEPAARMAAATMAVVPILLVFFFSQRYFVRGVALTGLK